MSLALLFVAGSFLQVLQRLHATDPGFDVNGRLYAYTFSASLGSADSRRVFYAQVLDRLRGLPGVTKASLTTTLPLLPTGSTCISFESGAPVTATNSEIDVDYFETMGIGRIAGREFEPGDATVQVEPVIVNAALASRLWPPGDAVGQRIQIGCKEQTTAMVVGVVRNSAVTGLVDTDSQDHVYRPFARGQSGRLTAIIVRTTSDPAALIAPVRQSLLAMGQGMRVYMVQPLSTHVEERYATLQWLTGVLTAFGLLALALAAVGLYGALAYRVARRTREIGVRMALGARRADVFREVLRSGLNIVLVGVLLGELATLGLTRIAGSFQQGVGTTGVAIHFAVALIWIGVALAACYLPAARAARVDPLTALRHE
jgi:putative ABC transport system permease protein